VQKLKASGRVRDSLPGPKTAARDLATVVALYASFWWEFVQGRVVTFKLLLLVVIRRGPLRIPLHL